MKLTHIALGALGLVLFGCTSSGALSPEATEAVQVGGSWLASVVDKAVPGGGYVASGLVDAVVLAYGTQRVGAAGVNRVGRKIKHETKSEVHAERDGSRLEQGLKPAER